MAACAIAPGLALAADPQIASFIDDPDPVVAGAIYAYTLRIDNNAPDASVNTHLVLSVPAGAVFVQALPVSAACEPTSLTAIDCALGSIGGLGRDIREVTIRWRALGPGPSTIAATATLTSANDDNLVNNIQNALTTVISGANLGIAKTASPDPVVGGGLISYGIRASNAGPNDAGAIVVTDNLPPAVSFVSASGSGWSCETQGSLVTCTRPGPHAVAAAIPEITLIGRVNAAGGTITNSASVAPAAIGGVPDPDSGDNTATVDTAVVAGADVRIAQKTVTSALPAIAGGNVTFLIAPRNGGPASAINATVTDLLPAGWTFVSASGPNWICGNVALRITCTRASLPAGATDDITVVARAPAGADISPAGASFTNTAAITSSSADPDLGNNNGTVSFTVLRDGADLRIAKSKTPNPVAQGSNMTSTIVVSNNGPQIAVGTLRVVERLQGETYVAPFPGGGWTCDDTAAPVLVCSHPNAGGLTVGASLPTLTLVTRADVNGSASNTACTGSSVPAGVSAALASPPQAGDPNNTNDCATTTANSTTIQPDLRITKQVSTPTGGDNIVSISEGSVTYSLVVSNVSTTPQAATGVVITDDIPAFVSGATTFGAITVTPSAGSTASFACTTAEARVTCTQTGGTLLQGQTATVVIPVNRPLFDGSYVNTATVGNVAEGDPNPANNQASAAVVIAPIADIEMTGKSVTPVSIRAGEIATYVLSFRNNGPSSAANVVLSDTFTFAAGDSGLTVLQIASSAAGSTCSLAAGDVLNPAQRSFTCNIGTLARGETQTVTLRVRPNFLAPNAERSFTNVARVDTTTPESPNGSDNGNNTRSATLAVTGAEIDLLVNKTDRVGALNLDPVPFNGTAVMGYQVAVTNNGPSYATNVRISENMTPPASRRVRFVCDVIAFGSNICNAPSLCTPAAIGSTSASGVALPAFTCAVPAGNAATGTAQGELAVGATKNIWLKFEALDQPAASGDVFNNIATASANEPDSQPVNNSEGEQTTTRQVISLSTTKTTDNANPTLMQVFNWRVTVANAGPGNSLRTDLTDTLPPEAEVAGAITWTRTAPSGTGTCAQSGLTISCALGQLNAAGSATVTVPVRITRSPPGGVATNTATVDSDPGKTGSLDLPGGGTTATSSVTVQAAARLSGTVFEDRDQTGANGGTPQSSAVEPRIAAVTITLTGQDLNGNPVSRATQTDPSGNYVFDALPPSGPAGYTLVETQPAGYANGAISPTTTGPSAPSVGGSTYAAGTALGNSSYTGIVLVAGVDGTRFNFPEVRRASLRGFVYVDIDRNGLRSPADEPISSAVVRLRDAATDELLASTLTAGDGSYAFLNLDPARRYTLEELMPSAIHELVDGPINPGQVGGVTCLPVCIEQRDRPIFEIDRIANIDLQAGYEGTDFNFGELIATSISGTVYLDRNRNGALDAEPGDGRLRGVEVRLVQGSDCTSGAQLQQTVTDAAGNYVFSRLRAGSDYLICETQPAGYANGAENPGTSGTSSEPNVIRVRNLPGTGSSGNNFGERLGSLSGQVWLDLNEDGVRQPEVAAESGIRNVTITLTGLDVNGAAVTRTTQTDASGNYVFDGLLPSGPSGYTILETQPLGYANGAASPTAAGTGSPSIGGITYTAGAALGNSSYTGIVLGSGVDGTRFNFPEVRRASLRGFVYVDIDRNGLRNPADDAIAGAVLRLRDAATDELLGSTLTAADGSYAFLNLDPARRYTLEQPMPSAAYALADGPINPGLVGGVTCLPSCVEQRDKPSFEIDRIANINLQAGLDGTEFNFGELISTSISGTVYLDRNRNGALDAEPGDGRLRGVEVRLVQGSDCTSGLQLQQVVTDTAGNYLFSRLRAGGDYLICESQPAGYANGAENPGTAGASSEPNVIRLRNLPTGGSVGNNFGERPASLSGQVWLDLDNDGVRQPVAPAEPGLGGVTLNLSGTDALGKPVSRSTVTDQAGNYRFDDLLASGPGGYTVTQQSAQPVVSGVTTLNGRTVAGSSGGAVTAVATTPSAISRILLAAGADSTDNRFGELLPASIAGTVFVDVNNNGVQNLPGDVGLPGVTLVLTGTDDTGSPVSRSIVTAANGSYLFADLRPGTYTVTEPTQPAGTSNGLTLPGSTGGSATPPATRPSSITGIILSAAGAASVGNNFAEIRGNSVLEGRVWLDGNNNGLIDPDERAIAGVLIELSGTDDFGNTVVRSAVTDANGRYRFEQLTPGTYAVREPTQPPATINGQTMPGSTGGTATAMGTLPSALTGIVVGSDVVSTANNFGELLPAVLVGRVYVDTNDDGRPGPGEQGLAGVSVVLSGTDDIGQPVSLKTTTDSSGRYIFDTLRPGTYTVTEPTQPPGTVNGITTPGTLGGTATPPQVQPSSIAAIVLPLGAQALDNNFGEWLSSSDIRASKSLVEPGLTVGFSGHYRIAVRNIGDLPTTGNYTVTDRLPAGITLAATPSGNGWTCTGAAGASSFVCTSGAVIAAGASGASVITAAVNVAAAAVAASPVSNAVMAEGGGEVDGRGPSAAEREALDTNSSALPVCVPAVQQNACRTPTAVQQPASLSGTVWFDAGTRSRLLDSGDARLQGWLVEVVDAATGVIVGTATTGTDGSYQVLKLQPGVPLQVRFRAPGPGIVVGYPVNGETAPGSSGVACEPAAAASGRASSCVGSGANPWLTVILAAGKDLPQQSLPVDPGGVVYDSGIRTPLSGAVVTLLPVGSCAGWNPATGIVGASLGGYAINGSGVAMTVGATGFYQFLFGPAAPANCTFGITVTPPAGYSFPSTAIAPAVGPLVPAGAADTAYGVQPQAGVPTGPVGGATTYFLTMNTGSSSATVIHNHIPLDPELPGAIGLSKSADKAQAEVGDALRYTITVQVAPGALPRQTTVLDKLPAGFTYIRGTAMVGDKPIADPLGQAGPTLAFNLGAPPASRQMVLRYRVRVGVGAMQGDGINRATGLLCSVPAGCVDGNLRPLAGSVASNEASYRVRVGGGVFGTDACVAGKVFVDCNGNHVQDHEELGIPGVRLVMQDGTTMISDSEGKYSACGLPPRSAVLKLDALTLPRGSRLTTSSNRNLGDAGSLWLDLKNGELHRADFIEGSCSNAVIEQVKARRAQGEVRAPETEKKGHPALRFDSKAHGRTSLDSPQQGTDGADQLTPRPRVPAAAAPGASAAGDAHGTR